MITPPPLITIGFTCFNAAESIRHAIESAIKQTWQNLEILIVDDGSSDNSPKVLLELQSKDHRIRVIFHNKNKGTAEARNTLAYNANGEFITFFDDDDESTHDRVLKQYQKITEYEQNHASSEDIIFCYCDRSIIKAGKTTQDHIGFGIGRDVPAPHGPEVADFILWRPWNIKYGPTMGQMGSGTMMLRTNIFNKIGYFDPQFRRSAEIDLAIRAALKGAHFISVAEPLLIQHKTQTSDKLGKKPLKYNLLLRHKNKDYLRKKRVYGASLMSAYSSYYFNKKNKFLGYIYMALACLFSPNKLLTLKIEKLYKKLNGHRFFYNTD